MATVHVCVFGTLRLCVCTLYCTCVSAVCHDQLHWRKVMNASKDCRNTIWDSTHALAVLVLSFMLGGFAEGWLRDHNVHHVHTNTYESIEKKKTTNNNDNHNKSGGAGGCTWIVQKPEVFADPQGYEALFVQDPMLVKLLKHDSGEEMAQKV